MKKSLCVILLLSLFGCATIPPIRTGMITSTPPGANVYFNNNVTGVKLISVTPCPINYKNPTSFYNDGWLLISMPGYENDIWRFPKEGPIDHNFILIKDISLQIKESNPPTDKEYLKRVIDVIGKCDKFLHSARILASAVASEANSEYEKFNLDFPQYKDNVTNKYLSTLVNFCIFVSNNECAVENTILIPQIQNLIKKIKTGIGI
jgi:hypothetical protein